MATADKLQAVLDSKNAIKSAINSKGGNVNDVLSTYADAITNLPSGGGETKIVGDIDTQYYNFIDYDGTLMYVYTDEELDALEELPAGPDHTADNLTFQEWNWDLADLKAWDRTRFDRPIVGANLITTDGKTYIDFTVPKYTAEGYANEFYIQLAFSKAADTVVNLSIDWGDGAVSTYDNISAVIADNWIVHKYTTELANYTITITSDNPYSIQGLTSPSWYDTGYFVNSAKLGNINGIANAKIFQYSRIKKLNIPAGCDFGSGASLAYMTYLEALVFPKTNIRMYPTSLKYDYNLKTVSLSKDITSIGTFEGSGIQNIVIPYGMTSMTGYMFRNCFALKSIYLPDSLTSTSLTAHFSGCHSLKKIRLSNNMTSIPNNFLYETNSLESLNIPNSITTIGENVCYKSSINRLTIPDSVESIGYYLFYSSGYLKNRILDLSEQTKVISLAGTIGLEDTLGTTYKSDVILVPTGLIEAYKSDTTWTQYTNIMIGV